MGPALAPVVEPAGAYFPNLGGLSRLFAQFRGAKNRQLPSCVCPDNGSEGWKIIGGIEIVNYFIFLLRLLVPSSAITKSCKFAPTYKTFPIMPHI